MMQVERLSWWVIRLITSVETTQISWIDPSSMYLYFSRWKMSAIMVAWTPRTRSSPWTTPTPTSKLWCKPVITYSRLNFQGTQTIKIGKQLKEEGEEENLVEINIQVWESILIEVYTRLEWLWWRIVAWRAWIKWAQS